MDLLSTPCKNKNFVLVPSSPYLKHLGYGTGVNVYKFDRSPNTSSVKSPWAVKITSSSTKGEKLYNKRLREEATLLRKMKHRNIIGFRQFTKNDNGKYCLAMEKCDHSLLTLIEMRLDKCQTAFPPENILIVGLHIARALDYLHNEMHLLHADIKSDNILIKGDFEMCKLCDFGVSLPLDDNGNLDTSLVKDEVEYGTFSWAAPETLEVPSKMSTKADIFAYGLVFWEMISLEIPQSNYIESDLDNSDVSNDMIGSRPPVPGDMLGEIPSIYNYTLEIFHNCTENDPSKRPTAVHLSSITYDILHDNYPQVDIE